jgi:hypothetical protein
VASLEWDNPLTLNSILKYPHPKLRAKNASVSVFGEPLQKLADEMFEVMYQCAHHFSSCRDQPLTEARGQTARVNELVFITGMME